MKRQPAKWRELLNAEERAELLHLTNERNQAASAFNALFLLLKNRCVQRQKVAKRRAIRENAGAK